MEIFIIGTLLTPPAIFTLVYYLTINRHTRFWKSARNALFVAMVFHLVYGGFYILRLASDPCPFGQFMGTAVFPMSAGIIYLTLLFLLWALIYLFLFAKSLIRKEVLSLESAYGDIIFTTFSVVILFVVILLAYIGGFEIIISFITFLFEEPSKNCGW